jgi:outer membrane protein OmpA-like peptidoglycan-associated protein
LKNRNLYTLIFITLSLLVQPAMAQQVQWASRLLGFSSQFSIPNQAQEYAATQILGKPSKMPGVGISLCAWQPAMTDNPQDDWITVAFDSAQVISQVAVAENFGQGCIKQIYVYSPDKQEYLIYENNDKPSKDIGKMLNVILSKPTDYKVAELKIVLNTGIVKGYNQLDAVGISSSSSPIAASINLSKTLVTSSPKENLGKNVNSKTHEVAPVISPDGKSIFFTRWDHPDNLGKDKKQDVWVSRFQNGSWQEATNLQKPINNDDNNAACSISGDGKSLYLINTYNKDNTMQKGMSVSRMGQNLWSPPSTINVKNYQNFSAYTEYSISANGRDIVMTAHRRNTIGGKDLYVSHLQPDSSWSEPQSLGPTLNTAAEEFTPFLASDGKTIYFSTQGHAGYGQNDIFMSRRLDDTWQHWTEPVNLGPQINSAEWDGYFTIPASGEYAYLCSLTESYGLEDIFRIKLPEESKPEPVAILSGNVLKTSDNTPVSAQIFAIEIGQKSDTIKTNYNQATGEYKLVLSLKKKYLIYAKAKDYLSVNESVDLLKETKYREMKRNLKLLPIVAGATAQLSEVVFAQSSFDLLPASNQELDKLVEMMKENLKIEIHLDGHTDNQGDWNANIELSKNRVQAVKKYLVSKGIADKRITTKAWGGAKPIASNETEATRTRNRRVEFTIKKK